MRWGEGGATLLRQGLLSVQTLPQASGSHLDATHHDTVTCNIGYFWNYFGHIMLSKQWGVESLQNLLLQRTFIVLISKRQAGSLVGFQEGNCPYFPLRLGIEYQPS